MELLTHKCVALVVLVCARLCVGLCPLVIWGDQDGGGTAPWADLVLALGFSLAGGVLLGTVFLHTMPEVTLMIQHLLPDHRLPVTELLVTAGFLFTYLLDEMITNLRSSSKVSPTKGSDDASPDSGTAPTPTSPHSSLRLVSPGTASAASSHSSLHLVTRGALLSVHALGQGAAVGLADSVASTWLMAAAAGVAGSLDSAASSARLLGHPLGSTRNVVLFCVFVTFVMAIGEVAGSLLWYLGIELAILTVLRGVAAGNLLYQAVYELLSREVRERAMGLLSLFVCLMGFLVIMLLQLLDIKSHRYHYPDAKNPLIPSTQGPAKEPDYEETYPNDPKDNDY